MKTYEVRFMDIAGATIEVEAENEDEAIESARAEWQDDIDTSMEIETVEELGDDD